MSSSCTATQSLVQCRLAQRALTRAEQAAPRPAVVYELTRARAYLEKAREEASEAHYGASIALAKDAERAAQRALQGGAAQGRP